MKTKKSLITYKSLFISDVHLGTKGCQADKLLEFFKYSRSENLYLVGDIIDVWAMQKTFYWPQQHNDIIQKILRKARHGTKVFYIIGNHDEVFRKFIPMHFGEINIVNRVIHETPLGKKYLVVHGDAWDGVMKYAKWLSKLGSIAYELLLKLNIVINFFRKLRGKSYWSLAKFLKYKVKNAVKYIGEYERTVSDYAKRKNYDGIICGHIHHAEDQNFDGINYLNCGDWVESCTALAEKYDGTFEIIYWDNARKEFVTEDEEKKEIDKKDNVEDLKRAS
ncbi:UDP-2,3-diacylglucosamine diphosphatase [Pelagibacterales bacterium SAG-MED35]|nr:UDP-2,3-diacylglucosamine diphosphatase [Pelagibacterales bacterium SAG-MED35]